MILDDDLAIVNEIAQKRFVVAEKGIRSVGVLRAVEVPFGARVIHDDVTAN